MGYLVINFSLYIIRLQSFIYFHIRIFRFDIEYFYIGESSFNTWSIGFNCMSTLQRLFHAEWLENYVHCTFIFTCFMLLFLKIFWHTVIRYQLFLCNTDNLYIAAWFQVFLSNSNNYMVSSNYFYLIIIICLHRKSFK